MANILDFPQRTGEPRKAVAGSVNQSGTVVLFTGVRVERHPDIGAPAEGPPHPRKGTQARRQRKV
jgi:hypothetical protein